MMELRVNTLVLLTNSQHDEVIIFPVFYRDFSTFTFLLQHLVSLTLTDFFFFFCLVLFLTSRFCTQTVGSICGSVIRQLFP